jgi:methionyl-tRNA formyltransferase
MTLRIAFAGTPPFAVAALSALAARGPVLGVLTQPDRPAGRGRVLTPSAVKQRALVLNLPVLQPLRLRGDAADAVAARQQLRDWQLDLLVVVAYGLILPPEVLSLPRLGCLNIHASLLPRWRGAAPIQRAVLAGDTQSGVTIMQMDEGLDTGAMLLRRALPITPQMVAGELHDALAPLGADLLLEALEGLQAGTLQATPQPAEGVTWADKLTREEARLDWQQPAQRLDRQIRAFNPWPAAHALYAGEPVKLLRSRLLPGEVPPGVAPGTVLGLQDGSLAVASGQGLLGIDELQRAGRRAVAARDFANAEGATAGAGRCFS